MSPRQRLNPDKVSGIGSVLGTARNPVQTARERAAGRPSNRISPDRTSSIGSSIGEAKPPAAVVQAPAGVNSGSRVSSGRIARIGGSIGQEKPSVANTRAPIRDNKPNIGTAKTTRSSDRILHKSGSVVREPASGLRANRESFRNTDQTGLRSNNSARSRVSSLFTRPAGERSQHVRPESERSQHVRAESRKAFAQSRPIISNSRKLIDRRRKQWGGRERSARPAYRERREVAGRVDRHDHVYVDNRDRIHHQRIWPRYRVALYYNWGPWYTFCHFYPYYHRRYVFVSLGGWWPLDYGYLRYYWYGYHPYTWYGYYPIAREVTSDTYNYYTYNYYTNDGTAAGVTQTTGDIPAVDHTTFADVREKLAQQAEEPAAQTPADVYFDDAVKAFEAGGYGIAEEMFAKAMELAPDDMVLPFAYAQALFAGEKYSESAQVLRTALAKVTPEQEGVFYPRGLYADDDVLFEQIDRLAEKAELYSFDGDLQFLLGYHLLGIGETDEAVEPLRLAGQDLKNAPAAAVLLGVLEKLRVKNVGDDETED
ncbi:MAG TPA: hypothetical protein VMW16_08005 [Sedimentisphaerales bacterium]|nr:hypothetical protein [Sedimentisphaerales bacterium]